MTEWLVSALVFGLIYGLMKTAIQAYQEGPEEKQEPSRRELQRSWDVHVEREDGEDETMTLTLDYENSEVRGSNEISSD